MINKFRAINIVTISELNAPDKALLIELIMRSDDDGTSFPSVQRLAMARGIKHEKNFKGADYYLPGIVTKTKVGRRNRYTLNSEAIEALERAHVIIKHTPAPQGVLAPAGAANAPSGTADSPHLGGANSSKNTSENSSIDISTVGPALRANPTARTSESLEVPRDLDHSPNDGTEGPGLPNNDPMPSGHCPDSSTTGRPAREGVSQEWGDETW